MIIAVGFRVRSRNGVIFRQWAAERIQEYIVKGFTMDDERLKQLGGGSYWKELLNRIRDIRASEKVFYRQILDIYATSVDYDPQARWRHQPRGCGGSEARPVAGRTKIAAATKVIQRL